MTPSEYCQQKATPQGSAFYYSLLKIPQPQRDAITAIAAFYQEIEDVISECNDTMLAKTKLNWWRGEVVKLEMGRSDHPVIMALQNFKLPAHRFIDLIDGLEQNLNHGLFPTFEEVTLHILNTAGLRELLINDVIHSDEKISPDVIYSLTLSLEITKHIQYLHSDVRKGLIFFAENELQQHQVSLAMLETYKTTDAIRRLLKFQAQKARRAFEKAQAELSPRSRFALANLLIRCEIALTLLREIEKSGFDVLENFITLTPLRRWWIARRVYKQVKR